MPFYSPVTELPAIKRYCVDKTVFKAHLSAEIRKPLYQLTLKELRVRLGPLLNLISQIAEKEDVDSKTIATYGLQLLSNQTHDQTTSKFCKEILSTGNFGHTAIQPYSAILLDQLEIGKQKYTDLKRLLKTENVFIPAYKVVALHRAEITLANDLQYVYNSTQVTVGICISYRMVLKQTLTRLLSTLPNLNDSQFPLALRISDGLEESVHLIRRTSCYLLPNYFQLKILLTTMFG